MKDLITVFFASISSLVALFFLTKLIGARQMSQMSMFDYINGITIGSIAAEMATSLESDFMKPLLAMIIYALMVTLVSILSDKSVRARRFIDGKAKILYDNGELYYKNLKKARFNLGEFLMQCRVKGYFDLSNVQTIILEANGNISILPISEQRPVTPNDLDLKPTTERLVANVIIDGNIMEHNLKHMGKDVKWLSKQLQVHGITDVKDVFLATCDCNNQLCVYRKIEEEMKRDILE
ncbi:MAG: DUF421 domain-containing protein [Clostridiales bacterium]|nr:DUF421 domain-containing protein [Clostridiales bacterium]